MLRGVSPCEAGLQWASGSTGREAHQFSGCSPQAVWCGSAPVGEGEEEGEEEEKRKGERGEGRGRERKREEDGGAGEGGVCKAQGRYALPQIDKLH